jgi:hypothetical protein
MQKIDQASGLKRGDVDGFRRIFVFETRNALTYENALKRDSK